jgi:hypothetical protein
VSTGEAGWFGGASFSGKAGKTGEVGAPGLFGEARSAAVTLAASGLATTCLAVTFLPALRERFAGAVAVATAAHGSDANKKVCCQLIPIPSAHILFASIWPDPPPVRLSPFRLTSRLTIQRPRGSLNQTPLGRFKAPNRKPLC